MQEELQVRRILTVLFGISLLANFATAQIPTKGNIFLGYSYGRVNFSAPITPPDMGLIVFSNPAN